MAGFDAGNAECLIFTFKEGLLSAIAHDLKIRVTELQGSTSDGAIEVRLNPASLAVLTAMKDGQPSDALSDKDKKEIEGNIVKEVLEAQKFPEIKFASTSVEKRGNAVTVDGNLTLHGTTKGLQVTVTESGAHWVAELELRQPDFGIKPYSAMMGTLKVKPTVKVQLRIPRG